jgi:hypothetical protein
MNVCTERAMWVVFTAMRCDLGEGDDDDDDDGDVKSVCARVL